MEPPISIVVHVAVVVAHERVDHPWQDTRWRPLAVTMDTGATSGWQDVAHEGEAVHYRSPRQPIELHRKETPGYLINLRAEEPQVYVVLRPTDASDGEVPLEVHLVTASPLDVQGYGFDEGEIIETVPMPEELIGIVEAFVVLHHREEPFIKRRRDAKQRDGEEHLFGKAPLAESPSRSRGRGPHEDSDA